jgi:enamine deaminase RidA (YjgF/YER057c/UK114 family)
MAYSKPPDLVFKTHYVFPATGTTLCEQLADCYRQFNEYDGGTGTIKGSVVKQSMFISVENNFQYIERKEELLDCTSRFFNEIPPTSIIAQAPENGKLVLELVCIDGLQPGEISFRNSENAHWLLFERGGIKVMIASCQGKPADCKDIMQQSTAAFTELKLILSEERMEFSDIIRQWNYIEKITAINDNSALSSQHYQVFNDVRSYFYQQARFSHGFPAATGIGMEYGGIVVDAIAIKSVKEGSVIPVKSPVQADAYTYTAEVLAVNKTMNDFCQTTPKFERAKILFTPSGKWVFISGTAAIKGQASIPQLSAEEQTDMTIQNILNLISTENLKKHGINHDHKAGIQNIRVYVKNRSDLPVVKATCKKHLADVPAVYLIADICRPELLVEIEAQAEI